MVEKETNKSRGRRKRTKESGHAVRKIFLTMGKTLLVFFAAAILLAAGVIAVKFYPLYREYKTLAVQAVEQRMYSRVLVKIQLLLKRHLKMIHLVLIKLSS